MSLTSATTVQMVGLNVSSLTQLNGGSLTIAEMYYLLGGTLMGVGTITGDVSNGDPTGHYTEAGTVEPGLGSGGQLNIVGGFAQTRDGWLYIDVTGPGPGIGVLNVQGFAYLGGQLTIDRRPSYTPTNGTTLSFLLYQTRGVIGPTDFDRKEYRNNDWSAGGLDHLHFTAWADDDVGAYKITVSQ